MKNILLLFLVTSISIKLHAQISIKGKTHFPEGSSVIVYKNIVSKPFILANTVVRDNKFEIEIPNVIENEIYILELNGYTNRTIRFISENANLEYDESELLIRGGIENELHYNFSKKINPYKIELNRFIFETNLEKGFKGYSFEEYYSLKKTVSKKAKKIRSIEREFIANNPNSFVTYYTIETNFDRDYLSIEEIIEFEKLISSNFPYKPLAKKLQTAIEENTAFYISDKIPNFAFTDSKENNHNFYNKLGKVTLIDFSSAKCKSCLEERENLIYLYKKYRKKGFEIIQIHLDTKNDLINRIAKSEQKDWVNVSKINPKNEILDSVFIKPQTPSSYLIDSNGIIIEKNLIGKDLEEKIIELIKQK